MTKGLIIALLVLICAGCLVGPDYERPAVDTPQGWRFEAQEVKEVVNTAWWEQFKDPQLSELIKAALLGNKDIQIAAARIEEYRGLWQGRRAGLWPQMGAGLSAGNQRITGKGQTPLPDNFGVQNPANIYQTTVNASWELDLWGRLRRGVEAAQADLQGSEEDRRGVVLSLVAEVAGAYVNLRSLDKQLEIARRTAQTRKESLRIFTLRYQAGIVSDLQLYQVKSEYEQALATIPQLEKAIAQQENALALLLGRNPSPTPRGKDIDDLTLPAVPAGIPSDLLAQRPDVQRAEQALVAANARVGAARAQYFPTIALTGNFGWSSIELGDLFSEPATIWNVAAPLTAPIFTGGALEAQEKTTLAVREQALLRYRQAVQSAFRDVEDALVDQKKTREQLQALCRQVEALGLYAQAAHLRYENGYISYIEVLDAERSLFDAELNATRAQAALFQALVNIYKAMGGGWVVKAEEMSAAAPD